MPDFHAPLDRHARRVRADDDALAAVRRRAVRNRRGRRIIAGGVSILIGAAGVGLVYTAFTSTTPTRVASGTTPTNLPIWPDGTAEEIDRIQQSADEGHQPRYLSPRIVAEIFATEVMRWERDDIRVDAPLQGEGRGFAIARIWNPTLLQETSSPVLTTVLEMRRWRDRADGIFVITKASSDVFSIERPLPFEDFGPTPPVFEGELGFLPDGIFAVGAWKSDISGIHAFGRPTGRYVIELADHLAWTSHPIATLRLIHAPDFWPPEVEQSEGTALGLRGPLLAIAAYRLGEYIPDPQAMPSGSPTATPVPGPTPTSDKATPAAIPIELEDATTTGGVGAYAATFIETWGGGRHGGYLPSTISTADEPSSVTAIYRDPGFESEAQRVVRLLFPGAEIRPPHIPDDDVHLRVVLGDDFAQRHAEYIDAFSVLQSFMDARARGRGAEGFLTSKTERQYGIFPNYDPDPSLYGYAEGATYDVELGEAPIPRSQRIDGGLAGITFYVTIHEASSDRCYSERLRIADVDGQLKVIEAFLSVTCEG